MLENRLPVLRFHHLRQVLNRVRTLGNRVENHVSREAHLYLLEHEGALSDHQHRVVFHLVHGALPLALLLLRVLADHRDLCIFGLEVGFKTDKVEVARDEKDGVARAARVDALPQSFNEQLVSRLIRVLKGGYWGDALQSHHHFQLICQSQRSVRLELAQ